MWCTQVKDITATVNTANTSTNTTTTNTTTTNNTDKSPFNFNWLSKDKMQAKLGFEMSLLEYRQIRQRLNKILPASQASENVSELLRVFGEATPVTLTKKQMNSLDLDVPADGVDAFGRVTAIGKRKSSLAKVTIIPGSSGDCRVNGRSMIEFFPRYRDIFEISRPLAAVGQFGKFNIWALSRGGGMTGKTMMFDA